MIKPAYVLGFGFSEGAAAVFVSNEQAMGIGFIDKAGKMIVEPRFQYVYGFSDSRALIQIGKPPGLWGYIDRSGNYIWKPSK